MQRLNYLVNYCFARFITQYTKNIVRLTIFHCSIILDIHAKRIKIWILPNKKLTGGRKEVKREEKEIVQRKETSKRFRTGSRALNTSQTASRTNQGDGIDQEKTEYM